MTDEEIKKLSEECALHYQGRPSNKGYELSNRLAIESYALMTLKWLSKDYAIVPKSKVKEVYDNHIDRIKGGFVYVNPQVETYMRASLASAMWRLFGKDMFEEEGK